MKKIEIVMQTRLKNGYSVQYLLQEENGLVNYAIY